MQLRFAQINGTHPLRDAVPNGYVDYPVRTRHGGKAFYFNFDLAKEMGLLPASHPHVIDDELAQAILSTFGLVIINEYDMAHGLLVDARDIRPNKYMATRYLQLQHPNKQGRTSGDGRSIWNGTFRGRNATWDISSCGTGATRLSPACALEKRFFRTGDKRASYGCGRADLEDGISGAVMSEIFHRSGVPTERTLAIILYEDGTAVNVRAGKNLLRPAHMFIHLKQNDYDGLKRAVDYYIDRQEQNGEWPALRNKKTRYRHMLQRVASDFARAAAQFESEYIFCWMEWDGDNILSNGGVIDYGSVRQFGLFHHEYRYDDVERWSTTITEQKNKARYIVQTFAQIADYLATGTKRNIKHYGSDAALALFDQVFDHTKDELLVRRLGLPPAVCSKVLANKKLRHLARQVRVGLEYFERVKSVRGKYEVSDGITWDAVFCVRDVLREWPRRCMAGAAELPAAEFLALMRSAYATEMDLRVTAYRTRKVREFQRAYAALLRATARAVGKSERTLLRSMAARSAVLNRHERVTGDAIIWIAKKISGTSRTMSSAERQRLVESFIAAQVLQPEHQKRGKRQQRSPSHPHPLYQEMLELVREHRDGI